MKTLLTRRRLLPLLATPLIAAVPVVGRPAVAEAKEKKARKYSVSDLGVLEGGRIAGLGLKDGRYRGFLLRRK